MDDFIQGLTGITDEMLEDAPLPEDALPQVEEFLGKDLLLGHNVGFDTAFLYDSFRKYLGRPLENDSLDHLRIARKLLPQLPHHRLGMWRRLSRSPMWELTELSRIAGSPTAVMKSCGRWP